LDGIGVFKGFFLVAALLFVLTPLVATVLGGFKSLGELRTNPFGLPDVWEWRNYADIIVSSRYWALLGNSLTIALLTVVLTLVVAAMAAFVFAHLQFWGREMLFAYITTGLLFPAATAVAAGNSSPVVM